MSGPEPASPSSDSDDRVGLPPTFKQRLKQILAHAAANDRTVIEFRTTETEHGTRHLSHALDITEYVGELEAQSDDLPDK